MEFCAEKVRMGTKLSSLFSLRYLFQLSRAPLPKSQGPTFWDFDACFTRQDNAVCLGVEAVHLYDVLGGYGIAYIRAEVSLKAYLLLATQCNLNVTERGGKAFHASRNGKAGILKSRGAWRNDRGYGIA